MTKHPNKSCPLQDACFRAKPLLEGCDPGLDECACRPLSASCAAAAPPTRRPEPRHMHASASLAQVRESPVKLRQPRVSLSASVSLCDGAHDCSSRCCACRCRHPVSAYLEAASRPMLSTQDMPGARWRANKDTTCRCQQRSRTLFACRRAGIRDHNGCCLVGMEAQPKIPPCKWACAGGSAAKAKRASVTMTIWTHAQDAGQGIFQIRCKDLQHRRSFSRFFISSPLPVLGTDLVVPCRPHTCSTTVKHHRSLLRMPSLHRFVPHRPIIELLA